MVKTTILVLFSKIDFTKNLNDRNILKSPHHEFQTLWFYSVSNLISRKKLFSDPVEFLWLISTISWPSFSLSVSTWLRPLSIISLNFSFSSWSSSVVFSIHETLEFLSTNDVSVTSFFEAASDAAFVGTKPSFGSSHTSV